MRGQIFVQPAPRPTNVSVGGAPTDKAMESNEEETDVEDHKEEKAPEKAPEPAPEMKRAMPERPNDYSQYTASKESLPGENDQRQAMANAGGGQHKVQPMKAAPKIGRNDLCPCGSGKKYKNCHGSNA